MRVTITGATGGIGTALVAALLARGDEVTVLARDPAKAVRRLGDVKAVEWDALAGAAPVDGLRGRDAVVHLAGEPIAQRWNDESRARIFNSRVDGTRRLLRGIEQCGAERPKTLVAGSALGYYGDRTGDGEIDERQPSGAAGFLPQVVTAWEAASREAEALGLRVVLIRTADVLASDFGVLATLRRVTKFGLAGPLGGGRQPAPWIHLDDEVGVLLLALDDPRATGPINAVAPGVVTQAEFARCLGRAMHRPAFAPAPAFAVKAIVGDMAELVLTGAHAVPHVALELGYRFRFPELPAALDDLL